VAADAVRAPLFRAPAGRCWLLGLLRAAEDPSRVPELTAANVHLYERALGLGGVRYPCDGLPSTDWARHFGPAWDRVVALKRRFDPDGLLAPGLGLRLP
jgi:FAD/FMN-containing dehydrogenase